MLNNFFRNFKCIKDINSTRDNLSFWDIYKQNRNINKYSIQKEKRFVDKKITSLECEETQEKIELSKEKLKLQQVQNNSERAMLQQKIEVLQNTAELKDLKDMQKDGKRFGRKNTLFILISCITSMFGLGMACTDLNLQELVTSWLHFQNLQYIVIGILFFIIEKFVSYLSNKQHVILEYFSDKFIFCLYGFMFLIYGTSIYSNFYFWFGISKSLIVGLVYAIAFDVGSYIASYYKDKFSYLRFDKSINNINTEKCIENINEKCIPKLYEPFTDNVIETPVQNIKSVLTNEIKSIDKGVHKSVKKRTGKSLVKCKDDLQKLINDFSDNEKITPKTVNMTDNRTNFYKWISECVGVRKEGSTWYKKANNLRVIKGNE